MSFVANKFVDPSTNIFDADAAYANYESGVPSSKLLSFLGLPSHYREGRTMLTHLFVKYACNNKIDNNWLFDTKELTITVDGKMSNLLNLPYGYKIPLQEVVSRMQPLFKYPEA
jgi:hypothetical protein